MAKRLPDPHIPGPLRPACAIPAHPIVVSTRGGACGQGMAGHGRGKCKELNCLDAKAGWSLLQAWAGQAAPSDDLPGQVSCWLPAGPFTLGAVCPPRFLSPEPLCPLSLSAWPGWPSWPQICELPGLGTNSQDGAELLPSAPPSVPANLVERCRAGQGREAGGVAAIFSTRPR